MPNAGEFFAHVPTTAIADASVLLGLSLIMEGLQPLEPLTSAHVAAPATTLQFVPAQDPTIPRVSLYDVLEDIPRETYLVVAAGGLPLAVLGANGARVAARRGAAGRRAGQRARAAGGTDRVRPTAVGRTALPGL
jgi:hypothetical protein